VKLRVAAALACALLTASCVGPATTVSAYQGKAVHTVEAAISEMQTVVLTTNAYLKDRLWYAYAEAVVSKAEDNLSSVQSQFDSIQPPHSTKSDQLRATVDRMLSAAVSTLGDLRISLRRHEHHHLAELSDRLKKMGESLQQYDRKIAP
jgi:ElaB/YqjD/DUF883 family membrane-anchored ribosome-binding protein